MLEASGSQKKASRNPKKRLLEAKKKRLLEVKKYSFWKCISIDILIYLYNIMIHLCAASLFCLFHLAIAALACPR